MHDLMNDLAQAVAGEIGFRLEDKRDGDKQCRIFEKARHSSYILSKFDGIERIEVFSKVKHLRTFLPLAHSYSYYERHYLSENIMIDTLPNLQYLRVLSLKGYWITEVPDSIGELKLLRYLDLSYTEITCLPESISTLCNLQTLLLECCHNLVEMPTGMKNLTNLRHLNNNQGSLKGMPPELGKLTNLHTLPIFVVGNDSGSSGVEELGPLLHLCRILSISGLNNVGAKHAAMANLSSKNGLDVLTMLWNWGEIADPDVIEMLQPPRMIKELAIKSYGGLNFPTWMGNPSFSNMVLIRLECSSACRLLPPLGQLVSLKELIIKEMSGVERVGSEFYGEGCLKPFPLPETLSFESMKNWKDWFLVETKNGIVAFPQMKMVLKHSLIRNWRVGTYIASLWDDTRLSTRKCERS